MKIARLDERLARAEQVLTKVSAGDLEQTLTLGDEEDALTNLEMGINFLIVDLRQTERTNHEQRRALLAQRQELEGKVRTIEQQAAAIRQLTTPVIEIWEDVLVLPVVGALDSQRTSDIMNDLLSAIVVRHSRCVIIDVTGVETVDTTTADDLLRLVRAAGMLGARCVLTGLAPSVAHTLVEIGADLSAIRTFTNLKTGLKDCLRYLGMTGAAAE